MDAERAADVFSLLADETRVAILGAVATAESQQEGVPRQPAELSFSAIYDRVDVDNTSKLSYHLGELEGSFLQKREDGYGLTHAGERVVRLLLSENYAGPAEFESTEVPGACPFCDADSLEMGLEERFLLVRCRACETGVAGYEVTPAQVRERSGTAILESLSQRLGSHYRQIRGGVCPACAGRLELSVTEVDAEPLTAVLATDECEECLREYSAPVALRTTYHPEVIAFLWERGVDVLAMPPWAGMRRVVTGDWETEQIADDPAEYAVTFRADGDELRLTLDADLTITAAERARRRSVAERDSSRSSD